MAIRRLVGQMLKQNGFHSVGVATAEAALSLFRKRRFRIELVLVDMMLPGLSGLDLAAALERLDCPPRILYMSGCDTNIAIQSMMLGCARSVLLKPFNEIGLIDRVRHALEVPIGPKAAQ